MATSFQRLMEQIELPLDLRESSVFLAADLLGVDLHAQSRWWHFRFSFPTILPLETYLILKERLQTTFERFEGRTTFTIEAIATDYTDDLLQAYYAQAFEQAPCNDPSFRASFAHLQVTGQGQMVTIFAPQFVNNDHFRKHHLPKLAQVFADFGFGQLTFDMVSDQEMTNQLKSTLETTKQEVLDKASQEAAKPHWLPICHLQKTLSNQPLPTRNRPVNDKPALIRR